LPAHPRANLLFTRRQLLPPAAMTMAMTMTNCIAVIAALAISGRSLSPHTHH